MKKIFAKIVAFTAILTAFSIASCSRESLPSPDNKNSQELGTTDETPNGPGIEIIFEGDLRAGGSIIGFYGDGKPVEASLQKFYKWEDITNSQREIKYKLKADQKIYLKALGHRFFDRKNPSVDLVNTSTSIEKVQLKDGKVLAYNGVINVPAEFSEDKSYSLRVRLDGGVFEEKAETFTDPLKIFPDRLPYAMINYGSLGSWVQEVIDELKTWKSVDGANINGGTGGTIATLESHKRALSLFSSSLHDSKTYADLVETLFFYMAEGSKYVNQGGLFFQKRQAFLDKIKPAKEKYEKEYHSYEGLGEDEDEYLMDLDNHFYGPHGYASTMAIYDVYVKDGVNKADNLLLLNMVRLSAAFQLRSNKIYELVGICNSIQEFNFVGFKKDSFFKGDSKSYAPFRSQDPFYYAIPTDLVDRSARTEWMKVNEEIKESKDYFYRYLDTMKAVLPEARVDESVSNLKEFMNRDYNYIKRMISDGYADKTKFVDW